MKIVKHSGGIVDFDRNKLKNSLLNSGAGLPVVEEILQNIESQIHEGFTTKKIYKLAFGLLKKKSAKANAARYNLRTAIQMLGPAGFFFEKFISRLFSSEGYQTKTNLTLDGKCVTHEVDVVVKKNNFIEMIECKFHPREDTNSDVKVPMYILSRFNDLKERSHSIFTKSDKISGCWIITNNRFTTDALNFGNCSGLRMLSWDYPSDYSLIKRIEQNHLYPITCLTTLTSGEKEALMHVDVILVKELIANPITLEKIGISQKRRNNILNEANELCK